MSEPANKRSDLGLALFLIILAAVPRLWSFDSLGLSHFDEGGYANSALAVCDGTAPEAFQPLQHFLSPPVFFGLSGLLMKIFGATDTVLIGVSIFFGILTAPLVFLVGREWISRGAAMAAGVLVALSNFHVLYSRMALTDVTFCFFFLLALWLYSVSARRKSLPLALAAGVAVGLAWNTKYHGWLAGFVAACSFLPTVLRDRSDLRGTLTLTRFALSVLVACAMYLPWFLYVDAQEDGYARLMQEQRSFLANWTNALKHLALHGDGQIFLDGMMSRLSLPLAALVGGAVEKRRGTPWVFVLAGLAWSLGSLATLAVLGLVALFQVRPRPAMLIAFLVVFSLLTPLYHPYTRLLLPWACGVFLIGGPGVLLIQRRLLANRQLAFALTGVTLVMTLVTQPFEDGQRGLFGDTFTPTNGLSLAAIEVDRNIPAGNPLAVLGEPAVVFYLRTLGREVVHVNSFDELSDSFESGERLFLVGGHYARRLGAIDGDLIERFAATIGDARLLDDAHPWQARQWRAAPAGRHDLELFVVTAP